MKIFGRKSNLAWLVLIVVLSSSSAAAACTWILWIKQEIDFIYTIGPPSFSTEWKIQEALATQEKCEQFKKVSWNIKVKQIDLDKSPGIDKVITAPNWIYTHFRPGPTVAGGGTTLTFYCLPDTIDPRK